MQRSAYPTDLTAAQWARLARLIPPAHPGGRPRTVNMREVVNAILYHLRAGGAWRLLPHAFPPWGTVHDYYRRFRRDGTWQNMHDVLRDQVRLAAGREADPTAASIASQSVKTTEKGGAQRGYDAGKQVSGRKRHLVVDTLGLLLVVVVHAASARDRDGAKQVLRRLQGRVRLLSLIWADGGYAGQLIAWVREHFGWTVAIVAKPPDQQGFAVLPRRWVVERTLAWLGRHRRLSKDYEALPESSEAWVTLAMITVMLQRLYPRT